jgi:hypothetical protein
MLSSITLKPFWWLLLLLQNKLSFVLGLYS